MDNIITFLGNCPQFGGGLDPAERESEKSWAWTKTALSKLTYYFKKVNYRRSNIVYRKGDPCKFIYIVYDGEFELCQQFFITKTQEDKLRQTKEIFDTVFESYKNPEVKIGPLKNPDR